jgi:hypothetical protein
MLEPALQSIAIATFVQEFCMGTVSFRADAPSLERGWRFLVGDPGMSGTTKYNHKLPEELEAITIYASAFKPTGRETRNGTRELCWEHRWVCLNERL